MTFEEKVKAFLTVSEVIDRQLLSGVMDSGLNSNEPIKVVSINGTELKNEFSGICTIGFIKSQFDRKKQLAEQIERDLAALTVLSGIQIK